MKKRISTILIVLAMLFVLAPMAVYAAEKVSSVDIIYDVADFQLYKGSIEENVSRKITLNTKLSDSTKGVRVRIEYSSTCLEYRESKYSYHAANASTGEVVVTRDYYMCVRLLLETGYEWPEEINTLPERAYVPLSQLNTFKVFLNGVRYTGDGYVKRFPTADSGIDIGIPIANDIATIELSPDSFVYDGKAKKPGVASARLKNGDLVNSRMYDVFYVDKNDREVTPVDPGTYYVLLKGTGIYGTGRKEYTIQTNRHVHIWDSGKITRQPTATSPGIKTYTCTSCGETKTEVIPKLSITVPHKPSIQKPIASKSRITIKWKHFKHTSKSKRKVWKKIRQVQIQCATDKKFTNIIKEKTVGKGKTKAAIKGLKKNSTYYVRIRYYDGKGYSNWSKAKRVKTKKK